MECTNACVHNKRITNTYYRHIDESLGCIRTFLTLFWPCNVRKGNPRTSTKELEIFLTIIRNIEPTPASVKRPIGGDVNHGPRIEIHFMLYHLFYKRRAYACVPHGNSMLNHVAVKIFRGGVAEAGNCASAFKVLQICSMLSPIISPLVAHPLIQKSYLLFIWNKS